MSSWSVWGITSQKDGRKGKRKEREILAPVEFLLSVRKLNKQCMSKKCPYISMQFDRTLYRLFNFFDGVCWVLSITPPKKDKKRVVTVS